MLISEELFLLLRRDDGKAESAFAQNGYGLAGAVVSDLILAERVTVSDHKDPRLSVVSDDRTADPVLDPALDRLREREGKKLSGLVTDGKLNPEERVAQSLADAGVLSIEPRRALGLVAAKYPILDPAPERALRQRLRSVLAGSTPTPVDGILLSILQGLDLAPKVLEKEKGDLSKKDLKRRIEAVSEETVAGDAVATAVRSMNAAMMTAVVVPAAAGGSS